MGTILAVLSIADVLENGLEYKRILKYFGVRLNEAYFNITTQNYSVYINHIIIFNIERY